jgi:hypothetical protein
VGGLVPVAGAVGVPGVVDSGAGFGDGSEQAVAATTNDAASNSRGIGRP